MEKVIRKIPILFAEWLLKNTDIFILTANGNKQKLHFYSGVYKDTNTLFDIFADEYKLNLSITYKLKKPTKVQRLISDSFNSILHQVENGESISHTLKKLNINRRSFYTHSTKEQILLLNMASVARRKTKCT